MKLLILGGTRFVGRHIVDAALAHGHEVTLFHRGQSNPDLFPNVEAIHGDRDGGLDALGDRTWDAVIDTCGYHPRIVKQSAEYLRDKVKTYCFISTISVYTEGQGKASFEDAELIRFEKAPESEEITGETYGGFKVLCEDEVNAACPGTALIVRPGLVIGPWDSTDRFTYWVDRFQRFDDVLVPDSKDQEVQFIDARDLAAFTIHLVETGATGAFNADGPEKRMTFSETVEICQREAGGSGQPVLVDESFLLEQEVKPWADLPLWVPSSPEGGLVMVEIEKGLAAGLTIRPLAETVRDLAAWNAERGAEVLKAGMSRVRELELLALALAKA